MRKEETVATRNPCIN